MKDDMTLKGLDRRMQIVEDDIDGIKVELEPLAKLVTLVQRVQWTFTGLVIYYIIDNLGLGTFLKLIAKGLII